MEKDFIEQHISKDAPYKYTEPNVPAVYFLIHKDTQKFYIGQTSDLARRLTHHFSDLRLQQHTSKKLQFLYNTTFSESDFYFIYKVVPQKDERWQLETALLNKYSKDKKILNSATENNSWVLNPENSEQVKQWKHKISEKAKLKTGRKNSFYGMKHTDSTKKLISKTHLGRKNETQAIAVVINGVYYESIAAASQKLKVPTATIHHRTNSNKPLFQNWYYFHERNETTVLSEELLFSPNSKPTGLYKIEGKFYFTIKAICEKHKLKDTTVRYRLTSKNFPQWEKVL